MVIYMTVLKEWNSSPKNENVQKFYEATRFCVPQKPPLYLNYSPPRHPSAILENIRWTENTYALLC